MVSRYLVKYTGISSMNMVSKEREKRCPQFFDWPISGLNNRSIKLFCLAFIEGYLPVATFNLLLIAIMVFLYQLTAGQR